MEQIFHGEKWQTVEFDFEYTNDNRIEVSNFGRIRSFNKTSDGKILGGSMINGYRIIRLKFFTPRESTTANKLAYLQKQVVKLTQKIKRMKEENSPKQEIEDTIKLLELLKKKLKKQFADDTKKRTIYYQSLLHRLVALYFLPKPKSEQSIVAHLDFDKLNNRATNLKWMTPAENSAHQQKSPHVIAEHSDRRNNPLKRPANAKLTITKVMLLKKMLSQDKPLKTLVKQFKITETQILRIKRGENWAEIKPAN